VRQIRLTDRTVDLAAHEVRFGGRVLPLTPLEATLLRALADRAGEPATREQLLDEVWGYAEGVDTDAVRATVRRLRDKLERDPRRPEVLVTVRGVGWRLALPSPAPPPGRRTEPLFGRTAEVATIAERLVPGAVLTLLGPGGIGKSTLAREALARSASARWVAASADPDDLRARLAEAVGLSPPPGDALPAALGELELVVVDEAEPALDAVREVLTELLPAAPQVRWLVTSRVRLGLRSERILQVDPLPSDVACELLADRAARHGRPVDSRDLTELVELLDRMPLALELVAPRVGLLGPDAVARLLREHGLDLVARDEPDRPDRHRALRVVLDRSWEPLSPAERELLRDLAVLPAGTSVELVVARGGLEALSTLEALCDASWVRVDRPGGRAVLLTTVRAYVTQRLDRAVDERRGAMGRALLDHAERLIERRTGREERENLEWVAREHAEPAARARALRALSHGFVLPSSPRAYDAQVKALLGDPTLPGSVRAELRFCLATRRANWDGPTEGVAETFMQALDEARRAELRPLEVRILRNLGNLALTRGEVEAAEARYVEALRLAAPDEAIGIQLYRLDLLGRTGRFDESLAVIDAIEAAGPPPAVLWELAVHRASCLRQTGRFREGLDGLRDAWREGGAVPLQEQLRLAGYLGLACLDVGADDDGIVWLDRAIELAAEEDNRVAEHHHRYLAMLGRFLADRGRLVPMSSVVLPDPVERALLDGHVQLAGGDPCGAAASYRRAQEASGDDSNRARATGWERVAEAAVRPTSAPALPGSVPPDLAAAGALLTAFVEARPLPVVEGFEARIARRLLDLQPPPK
jgi:predicted ATPase/DNA-binding winged helix-turn-helix (wHTH) protein